MWERAAYWQRFSLHLSGGVLASSCDLGGGMSFEGLYPGQRSPTTGGSVSRRP